MAKLKNRGKFDQEKGRLKPEHRSHVEKGQQAFDKGGARALGRQAIANGHAMLVRQSNEQDAASDTDLPVVLKKHVDEWKAAVDFMTSDAAVIEP